ncbi:MAG: hypothetical protein ACLRVQ_04520 [Lachnospiraceae bacterium]
MTQIYTKNSYIIFRAKSGFIVYNTSKEFKDGHTHLCSFGSAKYIINLAVNKRLPRDLDIYRLISLIRISTDDYYKAKIESLINAKKQRKSTGYTNSKRLCKSA